MLLIACPGQAATGAESAQVRRLGIPVQSAEALVEPDASVDTSGIWQAIDANNWSLARHRIAQIRLHAPDWTPPARMNAIIDQGQRDSSIATAVSNSQWKQVLALTTPATGCATSQNVFPRLQSLQALGDQHGLAQQIMSSLDGCNSPTIRAQLTAFGIDTLDASGLALLASQDLSAAQSHKLQMRLDERRFRDLADAKDWTAAAQIATRMDSPSALTEAAWGLSKSAPEHSRSLFARAMENGADDGAHYGFAATSLTLGDTAPARSFSPASIDANSEWTQRWTRLSAAAHLTYGETARVKGEWTAAIHAANKARSLDQATTSDANALASGALLGAAQSARSNGDLETALGLARQARHYARTPRDADMLIAWLQMDMGDNDAAQRGFQSLYDAQPDETSADGIVMTAVQLNQLNGLVSRSIGDTGPLRPAIDGALSDQAVYRGDYLTALQLAPDQHDDLQGFDHPWISQSVSIRKSGSDDRTTFTSTRSAVGFSHETMQVELGTATVSAGKGKTHVAPYISARTEGDLAISVMLATTPSDAIADLRPIGEVAVRQRHDRSEVKVTAFSRARDDTETTLMGAIDEDAGQRHGGVIETGLEGNYRQRFATGLTAAFTGSISQVTAIGARDNQRLRAEASLTRSFENPQLHYLSTGPFYSLETHQNNESQEGPESGGYYSPQSLHRAGWSVNLQTRERTDWIVRVDAAAAMESSSSDAGPVRPVSDPMGPQFEGEDTTQAAVSATIYGAVKISKNWALTGGASIISTTGFEDTRLGVALRYTPGGRASLTGHDLKHNPLNKDIW